MPSPGLPEVERKALLSRDRRYRYILTRRWGYGPHATFVMLNPSTANAAIDDATILKCMGFARRWKLCGIAVVNLYALRSRDPAALIAAAEEGIDPVGPDNDTWIRRYSELAARHNTPVVAAWGANETGARADEVLALPGMERAMAFGLTNSGQPLHPLMLAYTTRPIPLKTLTNDRSRV